MHIIKNKRTVTIESDHYNSDQRHNRSDISVPKMRPIDTRRRGMVLASIGVGGSITLPSAWTQPVITAVITPAHAQASVCPMIAIGNVVFGPLSGTPPQGEPNRCVVTFDVLSADTTELTITNITNSALQDFNTVTYNGFGAATDTTGPRVVWEGPATDAPFCNDVAPTSSVTFTVTATCVAADQGEFSQDFTIEEILMSPM